MKRIAFILRVFLFISIGWTAVLGWAAGEGGHTGAAGSSIIQNGLGAAANTLEGKAHIDACHACNALGCPNQHQCTLGYAKFLQAASHGASVVQGITSQNAALDELDEDGGKRQHTPYSEKDLRDDPERTKKILRDNGITDVNVDEILAGLAAGEKLGLGQDPKTGQITGPDGSVIDVASIPNDDTQFDGLPKGVADDLKKKLDTATKRVKKLLTSKSKLDSPRGGGGGYSSLPAPPSLASLDSDGDLFNFRRSRYRFGSLNKKTPASVKGLKRVVGREAIGVSGDSLFDMINRRYAKMKKKDVFIKE